MLFKGAVVPLGNTRWGSKHHHSERICFSKASATFLLLSCFWLILLGFFPLIIRATLLLMLNYKALLSVTPVSSCCTEIAGMLICSLEFYPALFELLVLNCFPCFSACMRYSDFLQGSCAQISLSSLAVLPTQPMTMALCSVAPTNSWNIGPTTSMTLLWVWAWVKSLLLLLSACLSSSLLRLKSVNLL